MSDESAPTAAPNADLEELERRMASFESATKRLGRSVNDISDPPPAGHASPPRPATRRLSESGAPRGEEISGLRPAVQSQGPQTGALTARARNPGGATPGFTSAIGRPNIPVQPRPTTSLAKPRSRKSALWAVALGVFLAFALGLFVLRRAFTEIDDAVVFVPSEVVRADRAGQIKSVLATVGAVANPNETLIGFTEGDGVTIQQPRLVTRLMVSTGALVAPGQQLLELADPGALRIVVPLPSMDASIPGDRVRLRLRGEGRSVDGTVESVLAAGAAGFWPGDGMSPVRAVVAVDPGGIQPQPGQGARAILIGHGDARMLLLAFRELLLP